MCPKVSLKSIVVHLTRLNTTQTTSALQILNQTMWKNTKGKNCIELALNLYVLRLADWMSIVFAVSKNKIVSFLKMWKILQVVSCCFDSFGRFYLLSIILCISHDNVIWSIHYSTQYITVWMQNERILQRRLFIKHAFILSFEHVELFNIFIWIGWCWWWTWSPSSQSQQKQNRY